MLRFTYKEPAAFEFMPMPDEHKSINLTKNADEFF